MSPHQDTTEANQSPQTKKLGSAESAGSAKDHNKPLEDNREYKILKAMEMAMADYNSEKAAGKESGALFERFNLWGHLSASLPEELWNVERVDQIVDEQVKKGRVIKRQGDKPGRYYLNWRDNNGNGNGGGNQ